jgi:hypothetical protein
VSRFEQAREQDTYEAQLAAAIDRLNRWLVEKHPEIGRGEATTRAFIEDMGNAFFQATDEDFQYSLDTTATTFSRRRVPTESEVKQNLIDEIMDLLQATNDSAWQDRHTRNTEIKKMAFWSQESLQARLAEILEKQRLHKLSGSEVREQLAQQRVAQQPVAARKILPDEFTRSRIHSMRSDEIKALIRNWGADATNDRLFGRS